MGEAEVNDIGSSGSDLARRVSTSNAYAKADSKIAVVHGLNRPLVHIALTSALQSAVANVELRDEKEAKGVGTKYV